VQSTPHSRCRCVHAIKRSVVGKTCLDSGTLCDWPAADTKRTTALALSLPERERVHDHLDQAANERHWVLRPRDDFAVLALPAAMQQSVGRWCIMMLNLVQLDQNARRATEIKAIFEAA